MAEEPANFFSGYGSCLYFQAAPAPGFFLQAAPPPRRKKTPGSGSPALYEIKRNQINESHAHTNNFSFRMVLAALHPRFSFRDPEDSGAIPRGREELSHLILVFLVELGSGEGGGWGLDKFIKQGRVTE